MKRTIPVLIFALFLAACGKESTSSGAVNSLKKLVPAGLDRNLPTSTTLSFSGYTWTVTDSGTGTQGPGPNHWSSSNAYVDASGYLHLKLTKNTTTNTWQCAQVILNQNLGYGKYQWEVEGRIDTLDRNVVFGMFTYSGNVIGGNTYDEMDIEYSRWGRAVNNNLDFTLYPAVGSTQPSVETTALVFLTGTYTTHRLTRYNNEVDFQSLTGFHDDNTNVYASKSWYNPPQSISTVRMPVYMNLWLFNGVPPANGKNVEIIIHNFKFTSF
jgi:hypothetical protein